MAVTVSIAGSTGSIGTQTLDVIAAEPDRFEVVALGAGSSVQALAEQAQRFAPKVVAIADASLAARAGRRGAARHRGGRRTGRAGPDRHASPMCA